MLRAALLPLLALAGGAGGFLLRRWELAAVFDAEGLPIPGAPLSLALAALSVAVAAGLLSLLWSAPGRDLSGYDDAFAARGNPFYLAGCVISALLLIPAGLLILRAFTTGFFPSAAWPFLALLCLCSAVCLLLTARNNFRGNRADGARFALLAPAYMCCLWMVLSYQQHAGDPIVLNFVYELLAVIAALLGFYFTASFSFARGHVRRCALSCLLAVYFSLVSLADNHPLSITLLLAFTALYQLTASAILLYNTFAVSAETAGDDQTQEVTEHE